MTRGQRMLIATSRDLFPWLAAIRYSRCGDAQMQAETSEEREKRFTADRVRDIERQVGAPRHSSSHAQRRISASPQRASACAVRYGSVRLTVVLSFRVLLCR